MSQNIDNLLDHERRLVKIIEHTQKELEAIRLLIHGERLRMNDTVSDEGIDKPKTISEHLNEQIKNYNGDWFAGMEITKRLIRVGVKPQSELKKLRPIIANYLRKLFDSNKLERKNIGNDKSPLYKYRERESHQVTDMQ